MAETTFRQQEGATQTPEKLSLLLLFTLAALLRIGHLTADPQGDEGVFYFLSESLFNLPDSFMFSEFLRRPLLPILFHPLAFSLESFRIINIAIGSAIPLLVYFMLKEYGISKRLAIAGALIVVLHPLLVRYSAFVFTDTLGTFFSLLMLIFFKKEKYALSALCLCLATLTKEYYAIAGLAVILIALIEDRIMTRRFYIYSLALLPITLLYLVNMGILGASAPGWSSKVDVWAFNYAVLSFPLIPIYLMLLHFGRWREFLLLCTYPVFYIGWHWGMGHGIENWFHLLPIATCAVCLCLALSDLAEYPEQNRGVFRKRNVLVVTILTICIVMESIILAVVFQSNQYNNDARVMANHVEHNYDIPTVLLVDCFWNYENYPFGDIAEATNSYTNVNKAAQVAEEAQGFEVVLIAKRDSPANRELRSLSLGRPIMETDDYILLEMEAN